MWPFEYVKVVLSSDVTNIYFLIYKSYLEVLIYYIELTQSLQFLSMELKWTEGSFDDDKESLRMLQEREVTVDLK